MNVIFIRQNISKDVILPVVILQLEILFEAFWHYVKTFSCAIDQEFAERKILRWRLRVNNRWVAIAKDRPKFSLSIRVFFSVLFARPNSYISHMIKRRR